MKRFLACWVVLSALVLTGPSAVFAQDGYVSNRYIAGYLGLASHPNAATTVSGSGFSGNFDFDVDPGFTIGAAIGVALDNNFRFEGELSWHSGSIDDPQFFTPGESLDIGVLSVVARRLLNRSSRAPGNSTRSPSLVHSIACTARSRLRPSSARPASRALLRSLRIGDHRDPAGATGLRLPVLDPGSRQGA